MSMAKAQASFYSWCLHKPPSTAGAWQGSPAFVRALHCARLRCFEPFLSLRLTGGVPPSLVMIFNSQTTSVTARLDACVPCAVFSQGAASSSSGSSLRIPYCGGRSANGQAESVCRGSCRGAACVEEIASLLPRHLPFESCSGRSALLSIGRRAPSGAEASAVLASGVI